MEIQFTTTIFQAPHLLPKSLMPCYPPNQTRTKAARHPLFCPVKTVQQMLKDCHTSHEDQPLLMFPHSTSVVPISHLTNRWAEGIEAVGETTETLSLHSLKRLVATEAFKQGLRESEIQVYGGWHSMAYKTYIKTSMDKANNALIKSLRHKSE